MRRASVSLVIAALLTRTSSLPNLARTAAKAVFTCAASATSRGTASASPPAASISFTRSSSLATWRAATATFAPDCANASAMARPIPCEAPVTSATLSFSEHIFESASQPRLPYLVESGGTLFQTLVHRPEFYELIVAYEDRSLVVQDVKVPAANERYFHEVREVKNFMAQKYLSWRIFDAPEFAIALPQTIKQRPIFAARPNARLGDPEQRFIDGLGERCNESAHPAEARPFLAHQRLLNLKLPCSRIRKADSPALAPLFGFRLG